MRKAVVLTSGGLDSLLTIGILRNAGIEVAGVHFYGWFNTPPYTEIDGLPDEDTQLGIRVLNSDITEEYIPHLRNPVHGYGSGVNPCIDCKLLFLKKAGSYMRSIGADFVATGEVLGQRPMSQRSGIMRMLSKRSGLGGYLLRPLSARLLMPTIPEELGWVDRNNLLDISGRGRSRQIALAARLGIEDYPSPAGGCLLTEKSFRKRFSDLVSSGKTVEARDFIILKYGRHFRLSGSCKLVVGRNQAENEYLMKLSWGTARIDAVRPKGPFSLMDWDGNEAHLRTALGIIARYMKPGPGDDGISFIVQMGDSERIVTYKDMPDSTSAERLMIR